jgi:hypothetical protein
MHDMADTELLGETTVLELIRETTTQPEKCDRWARALADEDAMEWLRLERAALLRKLAASGLPLAERQALANTVGRKRRVLTREIHDPVFVVSAGDVAQPAGGNATRAEVRRLLLSGDIAYSSETGQVRYAISQVHNARDQRLLSIWAADVRTTTLERRPCCRWHCWSEPRTHRSCRRGSLASARTQVVAATGWLGRTCAEIFGIS